MNPLVSHLAVLLVGLAAGAVAAIYWKTANDRRRAETVEREAGEEFHQVESQMRELIAEMRADLSAPETRRLREFVIIAGGPEPESDDPTLAYSSAKHADLDRKLDILKKHACIVDISSENAARFRMTEEFVRQLLKRKTDLRYRM